ncbi:MAG: MBL fold metallo-hydrolase [Leptolyngbyaceae cyanobacterium RU_5_1]|nr:MBL fold metallo-hydrolase [Leptolyngbyaceae cyanobacterium RU_5_1]
MRLTWIDLNSWIFQLAGQTILVDPWLVDPMVFYGQPWLYMAYHNTPLTVTPETLPPVDLILLSQGLDDHCHKPTLEKLSRAIPVVASPTAAKMVRTLGFQHVTTLSAWQEQVISDRLRITAIPGAEIQPGQVENGYRLTDQQTGETLYYEPHVFPVKEAERIGRVDVAIAPVIGQIFLLLGQVIMGPEQAINLIQALQPQVFLPTTRGDLQMSGILPKLIKSVGSVEEVRDRLTRSKILTKLLVPNPGEAVEVVVGSDVR